MEGNIKTSSVEEIQEIHSVIFLQNNTKLFSFAKSFDSKVEEMCLQHISILSMEGHGPDGLRIEENLPQSKRHFFAL